MSDTAHTVRRGRGRPKRAQNKRTLVRKIAAELHAIETPEGKRIVTTAEYILYAVRIEAMKGNLDALRLLEDVRARLGASDNAQVLLTPEPSSEADWIAEQEAKNAHRTAPSAEPPKAAP